MKNWIRKSAWWITWIVVSLLLSAYYANALVNEKNIDEFLPGATTDGHYQFELSCDSCHLKPYEGNEALQKSCLKCHKQELKDAEDSHPKSKFTDPRNADRVEILDARYCTTCHVEHKPSKTMEMGVTLPEDYCFLCHQDVAKNRPSHKGMGFETCDDAGCHNYHDNRALYEDYLVKHLDDKPTLSEAIVPTRNLKELFEQEDKQFTQTLAYEDADFPKQWGEDPKIMAQWSTTSHAKSGVNCSHCHSKNQDTILKPSIESCKNCHKQEYTQFTQSKHGSKYGVMKAAKKVADARQTFKSTAKDKHLDCKTCHSDHSFNTNRAAVEACLGCHDDEHSKAYKKSKHYRLWVLAESSGSETGVSCATCHMPRTIKREGDLLITRVNHNQNDNLRPNEKMFRTACISCHGLKFSLEALADEKLIMSNFNGLPSEENKGFEMARLREDLKRKGLIKDDDD